jgi:3-hydroxyacyl-CoA dehydrogenase
MTREWINQDSHVGFSSNMKEALSEADFVQENGPERPEFKIKLFAEMDDATPSDSIIASSSSGITMSVIQSLCKHRERCVIGHHFNSPHMIPLVEVVGGNKTSPEAIQQAMVFYASIGKKPINLRKEFPGHAANRLQAALYVCLMQVTRQINYCCAIFLVSNQGTMEQSKKNAAHDVQASGICFIIFLS